MRADVGSMRRNWPRRLLADQDRERGRHLDAGWPGADEHERQQIAMCARIVFCLGQLERAQDPVADRFGVGEALEPGA